MSAFLEITEEGKTRQVICGSLVTLGRDISSTLQLNDPLVSRIHALVRFVGEDSYYVMDAGSRNGSYLNSRRISTPTMLCSGDQIQLGDTTIRFIQERGGDPPTPVATELSLGETVSHVRLEIQPVTILVADIRDYTSLSERMPIAVLSKMMTKWFSEVQETVERRRGRVDKFIGDAVMALWYHGREVEQKTIYECLIAACELQALTANMQSHFSEVPEPVEIAVGVNTGMAAVGVGTENTAMGDAVNLAFRLETACRPLDTQLLISESTYQHLPEALWKGRETQLQVKGKAQPAQVCALTFNDAERLLRSSSERPAS